VATIINNPVENPTQPVAKFTSVFPPPLTVPNAWSPAHLQSPYTVYRLAPRFRWCEGTLQGLVAGAHGTLAEVIQVAAPYGSLVLAWEAIRTGQPPEVPDPFPPTGSPGLGGARYVLDTFDFAMHTPALDTNGGLYCFGASGVYAYHMTLPRHTSEGFPTGAFPYQTFPAEIFVFGPGQFRATIFPLNA
jgi:hypothetical protein